LNGTAGQDTDGEPPSKNIIPASLKDVYAEVAAKAAALRREGKKHACICEELNRLGYRTRTGKRWQHPQQIVKLLRSFKAIARSPEQSAEGARP
jgi:hypothetical protein